MSNSSIWLIDRTLSGATIPDQSGPGSDGNEGLLNIPQSSSFPGISPTDRFVSYPGHTLGDLTSLCRETVGLFYRPGRLGCLDGDRDFLLSWCQQKFPFTWLHFCFRIYILYTHDLLLVNDWKRKVYFVIGHI